MMPTGDGRSELLLGTRHAFSHHAHLRDNVERVECEDFPNITESAVNMLFTKLKDLVLYTFFGNNLFLFNIYKWQF
jgi:hypothetical protein